MKILAVDIGGTSIKLCISDEKGNIEVFKEYDSESKKGGEFLVEKLITIIHGVSRGLKRLALVLQDKLIVKNGSIIYANDNIPNYTGTQLKIFSKKILKFRLRLKMM